MFGLDLRKGDLNKSSLFDYYENELDKLISMMVLSAGHASEYDNFECKVKQVEDFYFQALKENNGIIDMYDILALIETYNDEIIWEVAKLDCKYGMHGRRSYNPSGLYDYDEEDSIDELYQCWLEDFYGGIDYGEQTVDLIGIALAELGHYYTADEYPHNYHNHTNSTDVSVVINDCQNLLLSDWHIKSLNSTGYHADESDYKIVVWSR